MQHLVLQGLICGCLGIAFGNVMRSIFSDSSDLTFTFGDESTGLDDFVMVSCGVVKGDSVLESV